MSTRTELLAELATLNDGDTGEESLASIAATFAAGMATIGDMSAEDATALEGLVRNASRRQARIIQVMRALRVTAPEE